MKKGFLLLLIVFSVVANAQHNPGYEITDKPTSEGWNNNASEVFKQAKSENAMIIFNFTGSDWCIWCKRIKSEIFETEEFKKWVSDNNIKLLEIDFPRNIQQSPKLKDQNNTLKAKFNVRGFPTIYALKGKKLVKTGYMRGGPNSWIENIESQMAED